MAIEDLKKAGHAAHLLVNVFLQVLVAYYTRRHCFSFSLLSIWVGRGSAMSLSIGVVLC